MFFSAKTAAMTHAHVSTTNLIFQIYFNQIANGMEINGSRDLVIETLKTLTREQIILLQEKLEKIIGSEDSLNGLTLEQAKERAVKRYEEMFAILNPLLGGKLTEKVRGKTIRKVKPKFTGSEMLATISFLIKDKEKSAQTILNLQNDLKFYQEKEKALEPRSFKPQSLILTPNSDVLSMLSTAEIEKLKKDYAALQTALKEAQTQKIGLEKELERAHTKIVRFKNLIRSFDLEIQKIEIKNKDLLAEEKKLKSTEIPKTEKIQKRIDEIVRIYGLNLTQIAKLKVEREEYQIEIEKYQHTQKVLENEIIRLELRLMGQYEASVLSPWFYFLAEFLDLSASLKYKVSLYLVSQLKIKTEKQLWHQNLFPLLKQFKATDLSARALSPLVFKWLENILPQTKIISPSTTTDTRLKLDLEEAEPMKYVEEHFARQKDFPLHHHTVHYLMTQNILFERPHLGEQLLSELLAKQINAQSFWKACWQLFVSTDSIEDKLKQYESLWKEFRIENTLFQIFQSELILVGNQISEKKLSDDLRSQNIQKRQYLPEKFNAAFLRENLTTYQKSQVSFKEQYSTLGGYLTRQTGFALTLLANTLVHFAYLNEILFYMFRFSNISFGGFTALVILPIYASINYLLAWGWGMTHHNPIKLLKMIPFKMKERKVYKLLEKYLWLKQMNIADFELQMWKSFLDNYAEYAQLTKKTYLQWTPKRKHKIWPAPSLDNLEFDRLVKLVVVGKSHAAEVKAFSNLHFEQPRAALVLTLVDEHLKKLLEDEVQKLLGVKPDPLVLKKEYEKVIKRIGKKDHFVSSTLYQKDFSRESLALLSLYLDHVK